jgi:uncharacterized protein (DUF427 family)
MTIAIAPVTGVVVVRAGGAVLGETRAALAVSEDGGAPTLYVPRADFTTAFLDPSDTVTTCARKGRATHYHLVVKSGRLRDAVWSYEAPAEAAAAIRGHLAFDPGRVTVERL